MNRLITIFFLGVVSFSYSQKIKKEFKGNIFTTDHFGNYYESSSTEIRKYNRSGEIQYTYSNNLLGEIVSVDASNPLKILVCFRDFSKILILDNTLSPTSELIDLTLLEFENTSLACRSYDDGIWHYNPINYQLIRRGRDLITTNTSPNIGILLNKSIQANFLLEYNNKLYLNDQKNGILVFDIYGVYLKTLPIYNLSEFQVKDKYLIYVNEKGEIWKYDFFTLENAEYEFNHSVPITSVRVEGSYIYVVTQKNEIIIDKISR